MNSRLFCRHCLRRSLTEVGAERQLKFYHLDGKVRYESKEKNLPEMPQSDGTGTMVIMEDIANSAVEIVADDTKELLCGYRDNAYFKGFIRKAAGGEDNDAIAGPLGMRVGGRWVDAQTVAACKVTVGRPSGGHTMEIARADGGYEKWVLLRDYSPAIQEVVSADGVVQSRTEMSDYRNVGDVMIAYKAVKTEFGKGKDGKPIEGTKYVFTVKSCEVGSKDNVPALYKMAWPDGTKVTGKDGKMYEASGGELNPVEGGAVGSEGDMTGSSKITWPDGTIVIKKDGKKYEAKDGELRPVEQK
jgi:hypothetical protein